MNTSGADTPPDPRPPTDPLDTLESADAAGAGAPAVPEALAGPAPEPPRRSPRPHPGKPAIRTGRLAGLSMGAAVWVLSWPILIESALNWLVGAVDTVLAAGVSEPAADAIGGAAYVGWFMSLVGMALGVGSTAVVSRCIGRGRTAAANAAVGQSVLIALALGVCTGALVALLAPFLGSLLRLTDEAHAALVAYLRILALGVPFLALMEVGIACCRGAGDAVRPLWVMVVVNVVNVAVSWTLAGVAFTHTTLTDAGQTATRTILSNPFPFDLGVAGIAVGTVVAWVTGAALIAALLVRGSAGVRLRARRLRLQPVMLERVVRIGVPNFLETLGMWLGNFVVIMIVGAMAVPGLLGAHIVAIRIEAVSFLPGFAMSLAAATLAGQWLGAGSPQKAARAILLCAALASAFMGAVGLLFILAPAPIVGWFSRQPSHLEIAPTLLMIAGFVQIPFALGIVFRSALRAAGDARMVMWLTWISTWLVRLPLVFLISGEDLRVGQHTLPNPAIFGENGLVGVWLGLCAEIVVRGALFTWRFAQGRWRHMRV